MEQFINQGGLVGFMALVIIALVGALVKKDKQISDIQDARLQDARETRDNLVKPIEAQTEFNKQTGETMGKVYELLLSSKRGK